MTDDSVRQPAALATLRERRSVSPKRLRLPDPDPTEVDPMLQAALCAPDHGGLCPWRVIGFRGGAACGARTVLRRREAAARPARLGFRPGACTRACAAPAGAARFRGRSATAQQGAGTRAVADCRCRAGQLAQCRAPGGHRCHGAPGRIRQRRRCAIAGACRATFRRSKLPASRRVAQENGKPPMV